MDQRVLVVGGERIPIVEPGGNAAADIRGTTVDAPTAVTGQYLPALDGLRAFAVAGVFAYHLGFGWASGGYLGVDLFFVLSGFLITSLLIEEWVTTARIRLGSFWARRARRLLPALFLVLVAIAVYVVLNGRFGPPGSAAQVDLSGLRGDDLATLFYVANWHAIFAHQSYFAQFSAPSPLEHTWSLAIEEQFYLVWPPVLLLILTLARGAWRRVGMIVTVVGALASAGLMALLYHPAADPTRLYFGTDTRVFDMLAGATMAMVAAARPQPGPRARLALHVAAPASPRWPSASSGYRRARPGSRPAGCSREGSSLRGAGGRSSSPTSASSTGGRSPPSFRRSRCDGSARSPTASISGTGRSSSTSRRPDRLAPALARPRPRRADARHRHRQLLRRRATDPAATAARLAPLRAGSGGRGRHRRDRRRRHDSGSCRGPNGPRPQARLQRPCRPPSQGPGESSARRSPCLPSVGTTRCG